MMDIDHFQVMVEETRAKANRGDHLSYAIIGLCEEAGEVAGEVKKLMRSGTLDRKALGAEIGDLLWYTARVCSENGLKMSDVAAGAVMKAGQRGKV